MFELNVSLTPICLVIFAAFMWWGSCQAEAAHAIIGAQVVADTDDMVVEYVPVR